MFEDVANFLVSVFDPDGRQAQVNAEVEAAEGAGTAFDVRGLGEEAIRYYEQILGANAQIIRTDAEAEAIAGTGTTVAQLSAAANKFLNIGLVGTVAVLGLVGLGLYLVLRK